MLTLRCIARSCKQQTKHICTSVWPPTLHTRHPTLHPSLHPSLHPRLHPSLHPTLHSRHSHSWHSHPTLHARHSLHPSWHSALEAPSHWRGRHMWRRHAWHPLPSPTPSATHLPVLHWRPLRRHLRTISHGKRLEDGRRHARLLHRAVEACLRHRRQRCGLYLRVCVYACVCVCVCACV